MGIAMTRSEVFREVESTFGQVPEWFRQMPESGVGGFWSLMRDFYLAETKIPNKYKELIGIAVSVRNHSPLAGGDGSRRISLVRDGRQRKRSSRADRVRADRSLRPRAAGRGDRPVRRAPPADRAGRAPSARARDGERGGVAQV